MKLYALLLLLLAACAPKFAPLEVVDITVASIKEVPTPMSVFSEIKTEDMQDVTYRFTTGEPLPPEWRVYELSGLSAWGMMKRCTAHNERNSDDLKCQPIIIYEHHWIFLLVTST